MHSLGAETEFLDHVYEAAVEPDRWTHVLGRLATLLGGSSANLTYQDQITGKGQVLGYNIDTSLFDDYFGYFATRNPLLKITDLPLALRVVTDEDKIAKEDLVRSEYYNDFLCSIDTHSALMFRLAIDGDNTTVLNVIRPRNREPFRGADIESARRLHPHLIRAFRLAARLSNMEAVHSGFEDFLTQSPNAVFIVSTNGKLRHVNPAGETLLTASRGLTVQGGVLRAADPTAARELQALIGMAGEPDAERRRGGAMLLSGQHAPISLTVMPGRSKRVPLFQPDPAVLVCAIDLEAGTDVPEQRLREVFGLSRAECRVAEQLLQGRDTRETAQALGLSYNTVRAHLVRMLAKTDTNRQTELIRKMTRALGV
ncbi:MAG TPA: helix-turn-helix transcriptional regulator [Rhizomicrobium sp.]